jgi:uncharacterized repeat protein (TIGR01451 family)
MAQTTGSDGTFTLYAPPNQIITVTETNPTNYVSTGAKEGNNATVVDDDTIRVSPLISGSTSANNRFGDVLPTDLAVDKSDSADPIIADAVLTYTLAYTNKGPSFAQGVFITDTLSSDVTYGGMVSQPTGWTGPTYNSGPPATLTWYTPTLTANLSGTIIFTVTVNSDAKTKITNTLAITSNTPDNIPGNNEAEESTTVTPFALIHGTVFEDTNGNWEQDPGESGIPGVTITLDGVTSTTTGPDGSYTFITIVTGPHTVVETDPNGYFSTTPNEVHLNVELDNSYQVDFGDAPIATSDFAAIYGTVFEDTNGNGEWDDDETGLSGVTVTLDGITATTTNLYGSYAFSTTVEDVHTVVETDPNGYFSTTANEVHVEVTLGNGYQVDFGDALTTSNFAAIYGTVFEDINGNGEWDDDETGLSGVTVTLDGTTAKTTNVFGSYSFSTDVAGTHTVVETDPNGYFSTTPNQVPVEVTLGNGYQVDFGDAFTPTTLAISKSSQDIDGPPLVEGDTILYTVQVTNTGAYTAFNVTVTDDLPDQVTCQAVSGDSAPDGCADPLIWVIPTLSPNNTVATLFITVTINIGAAGQSITNTVTVTASNVPNPPDDPTPVCPDGSEPINGECPTTPEPSTCPADLYEEDDTVAQAQVLTLTANQTITQAHTFDVPADQDWLELTAQPGASYTFATSDLGSQADTQLALYANDGLTILAQNDNIAPDNPASSMTWSAPITPLNRVVYLAVTQPLDTFASCDTGYTLSLEQTVGGDLNNSSKAVDPEFTELAVGSPVTYTITLSNTDARWAAPVTVTDTLPVTITLDGVAVCEISEPEPPEQHVIYLPLVLKAVPTVGRQVAPAIIAAPRAEGQYVEYALTIEGNGFTWVGGVGPDSQITLCVFGVVNRTPWDSTNTAWIGWNTERISRSATGSSPIIRRLYLPVVLK